MKYRVKHSTTYASPEPISVCHSMAWLTPRNTVGQHCDFHRISIEPTPSTLNKRLDAFENPVTHLSFNEGYRQLRVTSHSRVTVAALEADKRENSPSWSDLRAWFAAAPPEIPVEVLQFLYDSPRICRSDELAAYALPLFAAGRPILECVADLTARIHAEFEYDPRATTVSTPVADTLKLRRGVCQDFAHLQIAILRSLGLAARYVSGYVRTYPPDGEQRLVGTDASHAWLSVYCGDRGWVDVDPTNNKFTTDEHITIAWGRDYSDVSPLKGVYVGGGSHTLTVAVDVTPG